MAEISIQVDCGNSPKKEFLKDYHVALANGDIDFVATNVAKDIHWEVIGGAFVNTKDDFLKAVQQFEQWNVKRLAVDTIITHGIDASVNGQIITQDDEHFVFCDIYKFKGFKGTIIKSIKSFIMKSSP